MPTTRGTALKAGWRREAIVTAPTWPAASAAALTELLPLLELQPNDGVEKAIHASVLSGLGPTGFDVLSQQPTAGLTLKARYQGLESVWACALGHMPKRQGATLLPEQLAAGVHRHLYELDSTLSTGALWRFGDGFRFGAELDVGQRKVRRGTLAVDMQVSVWEWLSSMIAGLTLQANPEGVALSLDLVSHSLGRASIVNTTTTMAALLPSASPGVLFSDLVIRIGAYSASTPLGSGDIVQTVSWTLRLDNQLTTTLGPRLGTAPEEYERSSDAPRVTLTCVLPRHTADTWQTRWGNNAVLMADAKFTSETLIAPSQPYKLNVYIPSCQVTNAQLGPDGPSLPLDTVQLGGVVPSAAAAGFPTMSALTPLAIEVVSGVSSHPLL